MRNLKYAIAIIGILLMTSILHSPEELRKNPLLFNHHLKQWKFENSSAKLVGCSAGRRTGKSKINIRSTFKEAIQNFDWVDPRYAICAPTHQQVKDIYWKPLKRFIPRSLIIGEPQETELSIMLVNGAEIRLVSLDNPARIEGSPWNRITIDEIDDAKDGWEENVLPALADRDGRLVCTGVPNGLKKLYEISKDYEWEFHHWTSAEVMHLYLGKEKAQEILARARRTMDLRSYRQEYEASFETVGDRLYYNYDRNMHEVEGLRELVYNPRFDLILAFDFNVSPGVAGIGMEIDGMLYIFDEVHIPQNSTTPSVCRKIIQDYGNHQGNVYCYGDPTGGNRGTAKTEGSDWNIIEDYLTDQFGSRLELRVKKYHPPVRDLVNAMNSLFMTADGLIHCKVDPVRAPYTAADFYTVQILEGSAGEIDKKSNKKITHHSDSWMHYADYEHPQHGDDLWVDMQAA